MKRLFLTTALIGAVASPVFADDAQTYHHYENYQWNTAPAEHFSGQARFTRLPSPENSQDGYAIVEFQPNTITDWHTHSQGQYLIVTEGEGYTQEWGKPVQHIKKGDVVWCPPNVKHWHGATPFSRMSHIAIAPNAKENKATWLEKVEREPLEVQDLQKISQNTPLAEGQLAMVKIAYFTAQGKLEPLKKELIEALEQGLTVSEISEVFTHQYAYAGFPRALNGLLTFQNLLKERAEKGIKDEQGKPATPTNGQDHYTNGTKMLGLLSGNTPAETLWGADGVDYALKAHLFGYLFSRDNLSPLNRELISVGTLMALGGQEAQMRSHINISHRLGLPKSELQRIVDFVATQNSELGKSAQQVLNANVK
ncbi:quercetin dioxygenase-like cupin family protein [Bibersteinia trehalosi]|uniref:cupin domain-containing carboxymuconolactone decarboxylase family protein n=1 Tax=Bibersteinia trehalosi TaxID=47735 RepID=UPI0010486646|nr:carboxymuconolactone decarboxylase family protein [Bibersteinia trehalosi]TCT13026.1 quercetin dioxygenase-like cupin family protein [Bibersteinia trehalosi]